VNLTAEQIKAGRRWAYLTMLVMLALSIAGNLAHTNYINPDPTVRMLVYAIMWPLLVWAGVELFVRIPWPHTLVAQLIRWGGVTVPAGIAGLVSYRHLRGLLKADGEDSIVYTFGPLAVDGLMLMSTLGLLLTRAVADKAENIAPITRDDSMFLARIKGLEQQLQARDTFTAVGATTDGATKAPSIEAPAVPASPEVREHEQTLKLAEVLPQPVSAPPAIPGLDLGKPQPLPGWTAPSTVTAPVKKPRAARKAWDEARARELTLGGKTKAEVAAEVGVDAKTIQRLRARMIEAGELSK